MSKRERVRKKERGRKREREEEGERCEHKILFICVERKGP